MLRLVSDSNSFRFVVIDIKFILSGYPSNVMLIILEVRKYSIKNKSTTQNPTTCHFWVLLSSASSHVNILRTWDNNTNRSHKMICLTVLFCCQY